PLVRALALAAGAPEASRQPAAAGAGLVQLAPGEPRGGLALEPDEVRRALAAPPGRAQDRVDLAEGRRALEPRHPARRPRRHDHGDARLPLLPHERREARDDLLRREDAPAEAKRGKVEAGHGARGRVDVWTCGRVDVWTCGRRSGERAEDGRSGRWEALRQAQGPGWLSPVIGH